MGVKTEPMRNKKFSYSVIGTKMANTMPSTVRLIAVVFSDNFGKNNGGKRIEIRCRYGGKDND